MSAIAAMAVSAWTDFMIVTNYSLMVVPKCERYLVCVIKKKKRNPVKKNYENEMSRDFNDASLGNIYMAPCYDSALQVHLTRFLCKLTPKIPKSFLDLFCLTYRFLTESLPAAGLLFCDPDLKYY